MTLSKIVIAATGIFVAASFTPLTAISQESQPCNSDGEAIIAHLQKEWGEEVRALALNERGNMVRWLVNEDADTWSMVVSFPGGAGCLTASGKHFELMLLPLGDPS